MTTFFATGLVPSALFYLFKKHWHAQKYSRMNQFIAIGGIHTGIGKTIVAAVLAEAIGADYWKPVQAGIEERDTDTVSRLISNGPSRVHPEAVLLKHPMSPHAAARLESVEIEPKSFIWPRISRPLIIETAGGLLSPISERATMADFVTDFELPLILVIANYLGSINHTLMCLEVIRNRDIKLVGIIISGSRHEPSESFIEQYSGTRISAHIPLLSPVSQESVAENSRTLKPEIDKFINF